MAYPTKIKTFVDNTVLYAADLNNEYANIYNAFNTVNNNDISVNTVTLAGKAIKPSSDNSTAIQIQNAAGSALFSVDTSTGIMTGRFGISYASGTLAATVTGSGADLPVAERATCTIPTTGIYLIMATASGKAGISTYAQMQIQILDNSLAVIATNLQVGSGTASYPAASLSCIGSFTANDVIHLYVGMARGAGDATIYGNNDYLRATQIIAMRIA